MIEPRCAACGETVVLQPGDLCRLCLIAADDRLRNAIGPAAPRLGSEKLSRPMLEALRWFELGNVSVVVKETACSWSWLWDIESQTWPAQARWHGRVGRTLEKRGLIHGVKVDERSMHYSITNLGTQLLHRLSAECSHLVWRKNAHGFSVCEGCLALLDGPALAG